MMTNYIAVPLTYDASTLLNILDISDTSVVPCQTSTIVQIHNMLGLAVSIQSILYFRLQPTECSLIHIDKNLSSKNVGSSFALNLPLLNSDNVLMKWYSDNDPNINHDIFIGPNGTLTPSLPNNRVTCTDQLYYTNPHIVKIDAWHSVQNESLSDVAHFISIRFYSPLSTVMNGLLLK